MTSTTFQTQLPLVAVIPLRNVFLLTPHQQPLWPPPLLCLQLLLQRSLRFCSVAVWASLIRKRLLPLLTSASRSSASCMAQGRLIKEGIVGDWRVGWERHWLFSTTDLGVVLLKMTQQGAQAQESALFCLKKTPAFLVCRRWMKMDSPRRSPTTTLLMHMFTPLECSPPACRRTEPCFLRYGHTFTNKIQYYLIYLSYIFLLFIPHSLFVLLF